MPTEIKYRVPKTVFDIVAAECKDYQRRKKEMIFVPKNSLFYRTSTTKNDIILSAAKEVWGDNINFCETFIADIGNNTGWLNSSLGCIIGRDAFYYRKRKMVRLIAIRLNLLYIT
jgi:hypothetical protein